MPVGRSEMEVTTCQEKSAVVPLETELTREGRTGQGQEAVPSVTAFFAS